VRRDLDRGSLFWLGMVFVTLTPTGLTVRWSVNDVDERSLDTVIGFLAHTPNSWPVTIEYYFGAWESRTVETPAAAIQMLQIARRLRATVPLVRPFVKRKEISDICDAEPWVCEGFTAWLQTDGRLTMTDDVVFRQFVDRCLAFSPHRERDYLVYRHLGRDAALTNFKGRSWATSVIGKSCGRALADVTAGAAFEDAYEEVLSRREPRLDHIRARIQRPDKEVEWVSYQRLLVPMRDLRGCPTLFCLSVTTDKVSIPVPVQMPLGGSDPVG
jgi:hypothetical protein